MTIAEALQPAGYRTYAVGKWHVTPGASAKALASRHNWPRRRGFDRYYGTIHGAGSYWDPSALVRDSEPITAANDPEYRPQDFYYTDAISDVAVRFLREHGRDHEGRPFLLYVAYTAAHWPMHARESDLARYRGRYDSGYEATRQGRLARLKQLGLLDDRWSPAPLAGDWARVKNREFEARCMEVYAAMVDRMDQGIGRVVAELRQQRWLDDTLIFYLQDNGACAETTGRGTNATARSAQPTLPRLSPDDFQFGSVPKQTRDGLFWEHEGNRAVRVGQWKLVAKGPGGPWELYDMLTDRTETHDLAHAQPERVRDLAARWERWARHAQVLPWPWK